MLGEARERASKGKKRGREESVRLNGWIERQEKLRSGHEDLLATVMSGFLELQYMPVLKCNVIITWDENFSYPRVISNCF